MNKKILIIFSIFLVGMLAVGAASAADDVASDAFSAQDLTDEDPIGHDDFPIDDADFPTGSQNGDDEISTQDKSPGSDVLGADDELKSNEMDGLGDGAKNKSLKISPVATGDLVVGGEVNVSFTMPTDIDGVIGVVIDGEDIIGFAIDEGHTVIPGTYTYGLHTAVVTLTDDSNYENAVGQTSFFVDKVMPEITISEIEGIYGQTVDVNVVIAGGDASGSIVSNGNIYSVENGQATFSLKLTSLGLTSINVTYFGDGKYGNGTAFREIDVKKRDDLTFEVSCDSVEYLQDVIVVVLSEVDGTATVRVVNNGGYNNEFNISVVGGTGEYVLTDLKVEDYQVAATFEAYGYNSKEQETSFGVSQASTSLDVDCDIVEYGSNATLIVSGLNEDASGTVTVTVEGKDYSADVEDGLAVVEIPGLGASIYEDVNVVYSGDANYQGSSTEVTIIVEPAPSGVVIDDIPDAAYRKDVCVTYSIENGTVESIVVKNDRGTEITTGIDTTDVGKVIISGLSAGKYTISISNAGDANHTASSAEATFNVAKTDMIIIPKVTGDFAISGEVNITFTVQKPITGALTIKVDGNLFTGYRIGNGTITVPGRYDPGNHEAVITLSGDSNYNDVVAVATFRIDKHAPEITIAEIEGNAGDTVEAAVTIAGADATGFVFCNGTSYEVKNGQALISLRISKSGPQDILVTYLGDNNYLPGTALKQFTAGKGNAGITIKESEKANAFIVTVNPEGVTGTVNITVDGVRYGEPVSITNGVAEIVLSNLGVGTHSISAQYNGDDNFNASNVTTLSFNIEKKNVTLKAQGSSVAYGDVSAITVVGLPADASGKVSVQVEKKIFSGNVEKGAATIRISGLSVGTYNGLKVVYSGDNTYNGASATANVIVKKATPKIIAKKKTYKAKAKTKRFTITLKDNKGKAINNAKVRLIVKKISKISAKKKSKSKVKKNIVSTDKNGKATFKIERFKKGNYQATAIYYGNGLYNKVTKKVKITMK